jgi:glycosyltransferase A (GT-A) superfamily protein (DUF2064 family)
LKSFLLLKHTIVGVSMSIVIFAKAPISGYVKTRLVGGAVTPELAAQFYICCAERVIRACSSLGGAVFLFYASRSDDDERRLREWLHPLCLPLTLIPQLQSPSLGNRIHHALNHALALGHERVLLVGTDVPDITPAVLRSALQQLHTHQVGSDGT